MSKFTVDRFHDLRPGRYCWRRCLVSKLLCRRDCSSWCCVASLFIRAFDHPDALERQVSKVTHMLIAIRCVGSNVSCSCHVAASLVLGSNSSSLNYASKFLVMLCA
jgi:hypothetical protein